jgi:DNA-binding NtrC family response regulator
MDRLLIISRDEIRRGALEEILTNLSVAIESTPDPGYALKRLKEETFSLLVFDRESVEVGLEAFTRKALSRSPQTSLVLLSPHGEEITPDYENVEETIFFPIDREEAETKVLRLLKDKESLRRCGLVGRSAQLKQVAEAVMSTAATDITVLITGESGTGKELVASAIHQNSNRGEGPFIAVNCGAIAEGVLESELFGHERGAFTGAVAQRKGMFETADGGTIFLDEIGEVPVATQVKLLRVIEQKSFMRVGGSESISVDSRVVAATNKDLTEEVEAGRFRRDLYFRLSVVKIDLPPLRERTDDIPLLVYHFINRLSVEKKFDYPSVSEAVLRLLRSYHWPGNVRELRNLLESLALLSPEGRISPEQVSDYIQKQALLNKSLPVATGQSPQAAEHQVILQALMSLKSEITALRELIVKGLESIPTVEAREVGGGWHGEKPEEVTPTPSMEEMERELIARTLREVGGNRRRAAKLLGIGERTLYRKLDKYGLS